MLGGKKPRTMDKRIENMETKLKGSAQRNNPKIQQQQFTRGAFVALEVLIKDGRVECP